MRKLLLVLACLGWPFATLACALHEIQVHDAYVRSTPPDQQTTAAYMNIHNTNDKPYRLVAVVSDAARMVQLHEVKETDGVARMQQVDFIDLPAKKNTALQPGGYHIMLIDLMKPLNPGDTIDFTLVYNDGSRTELTMPVKDVRDTHEHH